MNIKDIRMKGENVKMAFLTVKDVSADLEIIQDVFSFVSQN
jgi:hypothetical protein